MLVEELAGLDLSALEEWDAYVAAHPAATCYHLSAWSTVAARAYKLQTPMLVARDHRRGPVRGLLPLFVIRNAARGYVTTGLFGAYGPILADHPEAGAALLAEARALTRREGAGYLAVKALAEEPLADGLDRRDQFVIAKLPLEADPQVLWRGFRDKIRNMIRKAQKSDLEVRSGSDQLLGYYDVLAENMHRKGTPIYGLGFMRELIGALGSDCDVVTLWKDGQAVSGALVIFHKDTVYVPFASSRPSAFQYSPNNLLYWEIIQRGCRRGMKVLDFGRSVRMSSTLAFKLGWGAVETPQPYYIDTANGSPPKLVETPAVRRLIALWQSLPRWLADALGPAVCRRFLA